MNTRRDDDVSSTSANSGYSNVNVRVIGQGTAEDHRIRQARSYRHSEYQPTGVYVTTGERLEISAYGSPTNVFAVIGVPEIETPTYYALPFEFNIIEATNTGLLSFINQNKVGHIDLLISSVNARVPTFELGVTSNDDWARQMIEYNNAPIVQLTGQRAIIVVRYLSAKSYLTNPEKLMAYYDHFIQYQDVLSGIFPNGTADYAIDPNKLFYVEADRHFMFATHGHMGFTGSTALSALLSRDTANGWGPWHESGHQRQLTPMTWTSGSGMTEVTVNLYSMAVQEAIDGRASRIDEYYPVIKEYLNSNHRAFNDIPAAFHKLVMLWQLRLTFGSSFYPQLHQRYRMMQDKPTENEDKIQRFIVETSLLSQFDLSVFFERWGLYPNRQTLIELEHLSPLAQPIWETDATHSFPIPIPYPEYIPERAYLLSSVRIGELEQILNFIVRKEWYLPYRYEVSVNGKVIASIDNGICEDCTAYIQAPEVVVLVPGPLAVHDRVEIFVILKGERYLAAAGSRSHEWLVSSLDALFTDERQIEITPAVTQTQLSNLFSGLERYAINQSLIQRFHRAQLLFLKKTFSRVSITSNGIDVHLPNLQFKDYTYTLENEVDTFSTLAFGVPTSSTLVDNVWRLRISVDNTTKVLVRVTLNSGHVYTLFSGTLKEDVIGRPIWELFTDDSMTALKPNVGQVTIDALHPTVVGDLNISPTNRITFQEQLYIAQHLLLSMSIGNVSESANTLSVTFPDDNFKHYRYYFHKNDTYCSEVNAGAAFYSSVSNRLWRTSVKIDDQDICKVSVVHKGLQYVLYQSDDPKTFSGSQIKAQQQAITQCATEDVAKPCGCHGQ